MTITFPRKNRHLGVKGNPADMTAHSQTDREREKATTASAISTNFSWTTDNPHCTNSNSLRSMLQVVYNASPRISFPLRDITDRQTDTQREIELERERRIERPTDNRLLRSS